MSESNVPSAVAQAAEEAEKKLQEMQKENQSPAIETPNVEPQEPVAIEPDTSLPQPSNTLDSKIDALEAKVKEDEQEMHKLKSDEGRYKKRIEELEAELRQKEEQIARQAENLQAVQQEQTSQLIEVDADLFSEEDREFLGEDYISMGEKIVQNAVQKALDKIDSKISKIEEASQTNNSALFLDRIISKLGISEERFEKIDNSALFEQYLNEEDASGNIRNDSLGRHIANRDVDRTVKIYEGFLATLKEPEKPLTRAVQPERSAASTGVIMDSQQGPMSYAEVANMFTSGQITKAQKDALIAQLDKQQMQ